MIFTLWNNRCKAIKHGWVLDNEWNTCNLETNLGGLQDSVGQMDKSGFAQMLQSLGIQAKLIITILTKPVWATMYFCVQHRPYIILLLCACRVCITYLKFRAFQGVRTWQPFVGGKNGHESFHQARIYNFCDKCVVFARNRIFANLTQ